MNTPSYPTVLTVKIKQKGMIGLKTNPALENFKIMQVVKD